MVKRWQEARTAMVVAECGAGKTLISLGAMHVAHEGRPYTALAMAPPHLVQKWAREALLSIPGIRVFFLDDMSNGGDERSPHGVNEVRLKGSMIVREGLQTSLSDLRLRKHFANARQRWSSLCTRAGLVHRRTRAGQAQLFLAPRLSGSTIRPLSWLRHQSRYGETHHPRRSPSHGRRVRQSQDLRTGRGPRWQGLPRPPQRTVAGRSRQNPPYGPGRIHWALHGRVV